MAQNDVLRILLAQLHDFDLEPRTIGSSDYPVNTPLWEVLRLARHCAGGLVLGFTCFEATDGFDPRHAPIERITKARRFPTPWNHLEAGILFGLELPLLVFREGGEAAKVEGGIFDLGAADVFVHTMPDAPLKDAATEQSIRSLFLRWQARVRARYYGENALAAAAR